MANKITAVKHKDQRTNIPTEELRDFVSDDERAPKKQLYPRDASLDPQLVWKGKDEQDAADLAVDVVPVYIQEKIHPLAIVEDLRASAAKTVEAVTSGGYVRATNDLDIRVRRVQVNAGAVERACGWRFLHGVGRGV